MDLPNDSNFETHSRRNDLSVSVFLLDFCLCPAAKIKFVNVESDLDSFPSVSGTDSRAVPLM